MDAKPGWFPVGVKGEGIINSLEDLQAIIEHIPVGMIIANQDDGEIIYANLEAANILVLPRRDIGMFTVSDLVELLDLDGNIITADALATTKARLTGQEARATIGLRYTDGDVRWVTTRAVPMTLPDHHAVIVTSLMGINDVVEAERQRAEMAMLQEQFVANVSHELRTPLGIIFGYAELAALHALNGEANAAAWRQVYRSAQRMRWLVDNVLGLAKIEEGADIRTHRFNLTETILEMAEGMSVLASESNVTLRTGNLPEHHVVGSEMLTALAIANLLSNAIKFSPGGSVAVDLDVSPDFTSVIVSDTGIGIDAETLSVIFQKFRQGDGSDTRRFGGTGIGLYFVKLVAEFHGGRIEVVSAPGEGATFSLRLPRE